MRSEGSLSERNEGVDPLGHIRVPEGAAVGATINPLEVISIPYPEGSLEEDQAQQLERGMCGR